MASPSTSGDRTLTAEAQTRFRREVGVPFRRLEAALNRLPAGIIDRERPLVGGGEGVKTHSAPCRTKPSKRGVAPVTVGAASLAS